MSSERMPQPPPGWKPKKPVSTVSRAPDIPGVNNNSADMNLSHNTERLNDLEEKKFIEDWDYENTDKGYAYYITLINGDEITLRGGHIPAFYIAALNVMCFYVDSFETMPLREIDLYLYDEED